MTILIINGTAYLNPKGFIADRCHKIWLIRDEADMADMRTAGWTDADVSDIHDLPEAWMDSCPLRFIQTGDLKDIVPQGSEVDEVHIQLIEDIDGGTGKDGGTIDELIGLLLACRKEYGGDTPVTVSYGTDDGEKPVLDFLL